jgi:hypothetical protein
MHSRSWEGVLEHDHSLAHGCTKDARTADDPVSAGRVQVPLAFAITI